MWGGGNSLNKIRMPSREQWMNIIESDMNGTIDVSISDNNIVRWNFFNQPLSDFTITQTNTRDVHFSSMNWKGNGHGGLLFSFFNKNELIKPGDGYYFISSFRPIIEMIGNEYG